MHGRRVRIDALMLAFLVISASVAFAQTTQPLPKGAPDNEAGKQLIAVVVDAHGGAKALSAVTSLKITLDATSTRNAKRHAVAIVEFPDHINQQTHVIDGEATVQQRDSTLVIGPSGGWAVQPNPSTGAAEVKEFAPEQLVAQRRNLWLNPIRILQQAGSGQYHFAVSGTEMVGDVEAVALDVSGPDDSRLRWLIDPKTGAILQRIDDKSRVLYDAWQTVAGIRVPARTRVTTSAGETIETTTTYEINPKIEAGTFEKPKRK